MALKDLHEKEVRDRFLNLVNIHRKLVLLLAVVQRQIKLTDSLQKSDQNKIKLFNDRQEQALSNVICHSIDEISVNQLDMPNKIDHIKEYMRNQDLKQKIEKPAEQVEEIENPAIQNQLEAIWRMLESLKDAMKDCNRQLLDITAQKNAILAQVEEEHFYDNKKD